MPAYDDLRALLLADADSILDASWFVRKLIPADRLLRIAALRKYWEQATVEQLGELKHILDKSETYEGLGEGR